MLRVLPDSILSLIYPQACHLCHNEVRYSTDGVACSDCWSKTRILDGNETLCMKCGAFLFGAGSSRDSARCGKCEDHDYDRAFAVGLYEHALQVSILSLKRTPRVSSRLRMLLAATAQRISEHNTAVLIPVPLSARRLRERGFNQAAVVAKIISRRTGTSLDEKSLFRKIHTPMHRAGMDRKARAITVKNAFDVARPKLIEGRDVLLVDDVMTSGETASMCAKVLKKNGATTVNVLTIARAA